jgi:hypothetical protein
MMDILWWIIVGVAAGWLAGVITGTNRGIVGDLILGLVGLRCDPGCDQEHGDEEPLTNT